MSAEQTVPTLDTAYALRPSLMTSGQQQGQWVFWLSLLLAIAMHAGIALMLLRSEPAYLGDAGGVAGAINVEIVDAGELRGSGAREEPVPAAAPQQPAAQAAPPPQETSAETAQERAPAQEPTPVEPEEKTESPPEQQAEALPALEEDKPQVAPQPKPAPPEKSAETQSPPKKASESKPPAKTALKPPSKLDLSVPFDVTMQGAAAASSASSATRPAGITRSGANDRFGRDVIRALKKTMPPYDGVSGKVKVRIFLNERGNVASVNVINSSGDRLLDDSVVFSVHQSSFPFPPKGATVADRTFLVTYNYHP